MIQIKQPKQNSVVSMIAAGMLGVVVLTGPVTSLYAQEKPGQSSSQSEKPKVQLPQTAEEHEAMAEMYRRKITEYQKEVEYHQAMLTQYKKHVSQDPRHPFENPYVKKMRLHCEQYINTAQKLIREAEKMAEYHRLRAAELRGK